MEGMKRVVDTGGWIAHLARWTIRDCIDRPLRRTDFVGYGKLQKRSAAFRVPVSSHVAGKHTTLRGTGLDVDRPSAESGTVQAL